MNSHNRRVLEFDKVVEKIAENATLFSTKEEIFNLEPFEDINVIKKELDLCDELSSIVKFEGGIEISGLVDISEYFRKIEIVGNYLEAGEVYDVLRIMRRTRVIKARIEELGDKYKTLYREFKTVPVYKGLEELISTAIDEDRVKDEASIDLRDIRAEQILINENIRRKLDDLINKPENIKKLQERIITIRDGRFVIPLKADFKGQIKGIEHDRSSSGGTVYIEPINVVALNNRARELKVREREEIRKILLRFTDTIRMNLEGIVELFEAAKRIDFINAKTEYAIKNSCIRPDINDKQHINLIEARHPLIDKDMVVPLTFELGKEYNILLITGPNTGGKTVTIKTAGLLTAMALSGIMIPAKEKSSIGVFKGILADIGDEQSIEQNLSSFSGHLKNVKEILEDVGRKSLVLLDELGSGTDPIEGAAFAMSVIDYLKERNAKVIISTHYSEVKAYGYNTDGVESASMEFNSATLSPTYRLLMGIPGESNALIIAKNLGLSDEIIDGAKKYISEEDKKVEGMINNIREKSDDLDKKEKELAKLRQESENLKKEYEDKVYKMTKEKEEIIAKAYKDADEIVKGMQAKAKALVDKIQVEELKKSDAKETQKSLNMLQRSLLSDKKKYTPKKVKLKVDTTLKVGDKVFVESLNQEALILKIKENVGEVQVQAGILKLMVTMDDIRKKIQEKKVKHVVRQSASRTRSVKNEIDIRGQMIDEAIMELDMYLDSALMSGYNDVYIIHGKGTGKLRKGIQEYLRKSRYVKNFRDGGHNEGGLGVTVATMK